MIQAPERGRPLSEWLDYLEALHPKAMDLGLDRVIQVYRRLFPKGFPVPSILIGGTNGKGTTARTLEWLLQDAGQRTATYLSPHLHRYNERVRINGIEAEDPDLVTAFEVVEEARKGISLTYFEFGTLAALWLFARADLDFAILEVGLGGRLDAVNVVDPRLAIICSVDLDHSDWLGNDRETIGFEKAGILRPNIDAIYGEPNPPESVLQQVAAQRVKLRLLGRDYGPAEATGEAPTEALDCYLEYQGKPVRISLPDPRVPVRSAMTALQALAILGFDPCQRNLTDMAVRVQVPGRFETMGTAPVVVLDVGHNPHAARWLSQRLVATFPGKRMIGVYACLQDKDCENVIAALKSTIDRWYLAGLDVPRGLSVSDLERRIGGQLESRYVTRKTVPEALGSAMSEAGEGDVVVVFGSFFTVGQAREALLNGLLSHPSSNPL